MKNWERAKFHSNSIFFQEIVLNVIKKTLLTLICCLILLHVSQTEFCTIIDSWCVYNFLNYSLFVRLLNIEHSYNNAY